MASTTKFKKINQKEKCTWLCYTFPTHHINTSLHLITWDFGSSFKFIHLFSFIRLFPSLSQSHFFLSLSLCVCHLEEQAELGWKLEKSKLKNLYRKKKKKSCGTCMQLRQSCSTQVRPPFSHTCASQLERLQRNFLRGGLWEAFKFHLVE